MWVFEEGPETTALINNMTLKEIRERDKNSPSVKEVRENAIKDKSPDEAYRIGYESAIGDVWQMMVMDGKMKEASLLWKWAFPNKPDPLNPPKPLTLREAVTKAKETASKGSMNDKPTWHLTAESVELIEQALLAP
jgi:hypothetical protein